METIALFICRVISGTMAGKTSAVKKYYYNREEIAAAQGKVNDKIDAMKKEADDNFKAAMERGPTLQEIQNYQRFTQNASRIKPLSENKHQKSDPMFNKFGSINFARKEANSAKKEYNEAKERGEDKETLNRLSSEYDRAIDRYGNAPIDSRTPEQKAAEKKRQSEIKGQVKRVKDPKEIKEEDKDLAFKRFRNERARDNIAREKGITPDKVTDKDIEDYVKTTNEAYPNYESSLREEYTINERAKAIAIKRLQDEGKVVTEDAVNALIADGSLLDQAKTEIMEERQPKYGYHKKDPQMPWSYNGRPTSEYIAEAMSHLTEDQKNHQFVTVEEAESFIRSVCPDISEEDRKRLAQGVYAQGATLAMLGSALQARVSRQADDKKEAEEKARKELELRQAVRRKYWRAAAAASMVVGNLMRGVPNALNVHLRATHNLFKAFMSPHPMSAASQAVTAVATGVAEGWNVLKDMNKTYGISDPDNPYSKGLLMGTLKGAKYYREREQAESDLVDLLKMQYDTMNDLGITDPTNVTGEQYRQYVNKLQPDMLAKLRNLEAKKAWNGMNMKHGQPDSMTFPEKMMLQALKTMTKEMRDGMTMVNKVELAQKGPKFQQALQQIQQASGVSPLPPVDMNNVATVEPDFEKEDAYVLTLKTELNDLEKKKKEENTREYDARISAIRHYMSEHNTKKGEIKAAREQRNESFRNTMFTTVCNGLNTTDFDQMNYSELDTVKNNLFNTYGYIKDMRNRTDLNNDQKAMVGLFSEIEDIIDNCKKNNHSIDAYNEKTQMLNTHNNIIQKIPNSPVDLGNGTKAYIDPSIQKDDLSTLLIGTLMFNIDNGDIDKIKTGKTTALLDEKNNDTGYFRLDGTNNNTLVDKLSNYSNNLKTAQTRNILHQAGYTDAQIDDYIKKVDSYASELDSFNRRIGKYADYRTNPDLMPEKRFLVPDGNDPSLMLNTNWWSEHKTNPHAFTIEVEDAIAAYEYEEKKNPDAFKHQQQLNACYALRHNLQIYGLMYNLESTLAYRNDLNSADKARIRSQFKGLSSLYLVKYGSKMTSDDLKYEKDPKERERYTKYILKGLGVLNAKIGRATPSNRVKIQQISSQLASLGGSFLATPVNNIEDLLDRMEKEIEKNGDRNGLIFNAVLSMLDQRNTLSDDTMTMVSRRSDPAFKFDKLREEVGLCFGKTGTKKGTDDKYDMLVYSVSSMYNTYFDRGFPSDQIFRGEETYRLMADLTNPSSDRINNEAKIDGFLNKVKTNEYMCNELNNALTLELGTGADSIKTQIDKLKKLGTLSTDLLKDRINDIVNRSSLKADQKDLAKGIAQQIVNQHESDVNYIDNNRDIIKKQLLDHSSRIINNVINYYGTDAKYKKDYDGKLYDYIITKQGLNKGTIDLDKIISDIDKNLQINKISTNYRTLEKITRLSDKDLSTYCVDLMRRDVDAYTELCNSMEELPKLTSDKVQEIIKGAPTHTQMVFYKLFKNIDRLQGIIENHI